MEQLGPEPVLIWNDDITGSDLTLCTRKLGHRDNLVKVRDEHLISSASKGGGEGERISRPLHFRRNLFLFWIYVFTD